MTKKKTATPNHFELRKVSPLTNAQKEAFDAYQHGQHMILHGYAGTGKTYIALFLALRQVLLGLSAYERILVIRSTVSTRDPGFLPGNAKEKNRIYEEPYRAICDKLFDRGDGYELLKMKNLVNFESTAFLRGITFERTIIIADEIENMSFQELDTITTRMGEGSRLILCGDYRQSDLEKATERQGLHDYMRIITELEGFAHIEFGVEDIVRGNLVRDYIIKKAELGM